MAQITDTLPEIDFKGVGEWEGSDAVLAVKYYGVEIDASSIDAATGLREWPVEGDELEVLFGFIRAAEVQLDKVKGIGTFYVEYEVKYDAASMNRTVKIKRVRKPGRGEGVGVIAYDELGALNKFINAAKQLGYEVE